MANYSNLTAYIASQVYQNANNEVTADMVKAAMNQMVTSLGAGYQYMGVADLNTPSSSPDYKCFYVVSEAGTYTNFLDSNNDPLVVNDGEICIFKWDSAWSKVVTGAATASAVNNAKEISLVNEIQLSDMTKIAGAVINASAKIISSGHSDVYYYPVTKGNVYRLDSTVSWGDYTAVAFKITTPVMNEYCDEKIIGYTIPTESVYYTPQSDGYIVILYHDGDRGKIYVQDNDALLDLMNAFEPVPNLLSDLEPIPEQITELDEAVSKYEVITLDNGLVLLGNAYLNIAGGGAAGRILSFAYSTIYYYPVVAGKKYKLSSSVNWNSGYASIGFIATTPQIGEYYDSVILVSDTPTTEMFYTPATNGYILLCYRDNGESHIYNWVKISSKELQERIDELDVSVAGTLRNKTIAILGDSIMQFMGGDVPENTITLKNYSDPSDTTVYYEADATIVSGLLYLTSSLDNGNVTQNSVRLEIVNSAQADIDSRGWDYIKNKLGAKKIVNCGQGGGKFTEMGIVTPYPSVNPGDAYGAYLQSFPNQVKMLKRLVSSGLCDEPDCIVIWMGVNGTTLYVNDTLNDAMAIPWDTLKDDALGFSYRSKFFGALRYGIEALYREYPTALIIFVTPVMNQMGNLSINSDTPAYRGYDDLKQTSINIRQIAERYSCMVFDALHQIGLANFAHHADTQSGDNQIATGTPLGNLVPYYLKNNDGLHPNANGKILWGNYLCRLLSSFYFDKG